MSIKNDRWIAHMAKKYGMIVPYVEKQVGAGIISYGPSSFGYDMRAGLDWKIFTDINGAVVDPKNQNLQAYHSFRVLSGDAVIIPPNSYALTHTIEHVRVPRNVTCVCVGKSTYARCGIHVNVTPLEAGWEGQVTIEISNGTRLPVKVYAGEGIMQVLFFEGEDPETSYADRKGKYQGQKGITLAKVLEDEEDDSDPARKLRLNLEGASNISKMSDEEFTDHLGQKFNAAMSKGRRKSAKKPARRTAKRTNRSARSRVR